VEAARFRVFRFVIQRFGALRRIWLVTQAFDFGLGVLTVVTAPRVAGAIQSIKKSLRAWTGVSMSRHPLGGSQFNCNETELGHIHSNGVADLRLTATEQSEVLAAGLAQRHHTAPKSTWVTFYIEQENQIEALISLFQIPFARVSNLQRVSTESPSEEYVP